MRTILVLLAAAVTAAPATGQTSIRRVEATAFPLAVTLSGGLGFGGKRATFTDSVLCAGPDCGSAGAGSGWTASLDLRAPLGRTLGVEVAGHIGHPSQRLCFRGACQSSGETWALRGSAMLLWRFKPQAPIYFGLGAAVTRFDPAPVVNQNLTFDEEVGLVQGGTTEFGASTAVGYDFALQGRVAGTLVWRSYLMSPSSEGLPAGYESKSVAWDNSLAFGVRYFLGG
jgi:hypothetical protein